MGIRDEHPGLPAKIDKHLVALYGYSWSQGFEPRWCVNYEDEEGERGYVAPARLSKYLRLLGMDTYYIDRLQSSETP